MKKASDVLKVLFNERDYESAKNYSKFFSGWEKIAGNNIAAHSKIAEISKGTCIIEVDHPGWVQMIQFKRNFFLNKMKRNYPQLKIKNIKIVLNSNVIIPKKLEKVDTDIKNKKVKKIEKSEEKNNEHSKKNFLDIMDKLGKSIKDNSKKP